MKRNTDLWQHMGFGAVSLGGTLLHFLYDRTDSPLCALISGVNESIWEHMKLLFFPMLVFLDYRASLGQAFTHSIQRIHSVPFTRLRLLSVISTSMGQTRLHLPQETHLDGSQVIRESEK